MEFARKAYFFTLDLLQTVLLAASIFLVIYIFLFRPFQVSGESMYPTFKNQQYILTNLIALRFETLHRGDVIVFHAPPDKEKDFIKRVIGLPGDRVRCCDDRGRLQINGVSLDEPYLYPGDVASLDRFDVMVPPGRLWVMGDHRSRSSDSRAHLGDPGGGTVPIDKVIGRAVAIVWPPSRLRRLGIPDSFERLNTNGRALGDRTGRAAASAAVAAPDRSP